MFGTAIPKAWLGEIEDDKWCAQCNIIKYKSIGRCNHKLRIRSSMEKNLRCLLSPFSNWNNTDCYGVPTSIAKMDKNVIGNHYYSFLNIYWQCFSDWQKVVDDPNSTIMDNYDWNLWWWFKRNSDSDIFGDHWHYL